MNSFQIYSDLVLDIEILKEQIELCKAEQKQWWLGGRLVNTVSLDNAAERVDKLSEKIERMEEELQIKTERAEKFNQRLQQYQGLEYKIFYMRYIECKTLKEIAEELNYSYQYIRHIAGQIKKKSV